MENGLEAGNRFNPKHGFPDVERRKKMKDLERPHKCGTELLA